MSDDNDKEYEYDVDKQQYDYDYYGDEQLAPASSSTGEPTDSSLDESHSGPSPSSGTTGSGQVPGTTSRKPKGSVRFSEAPQLTFPPATNAASASSNSNNSRRLVGKTPKRSSPLSSPPILSSRKKGSKRIPEEEHQNQDQNAPEDYFSVERRGSNSRSPGESPSLFLTRPDSSQVDITNSRHHDHDGESESESDGDDYRQHPYTDERATLIGGGEEEEGYDSEGSGPSHPPPPQPAHTRQQQQEVPQPHDINDERTQAGLLNNLLQMGLYSGGLAPGASSFRKEDDDANIGNDLKERREELLRNLGSHSAPGSTFSTPKVVPVEEEEAQQPGDIPLLELDRKLSEVKDQKETAEYQGIAENLVRSHTLHGNQLESMDYDYSKGYLVATRDYYGSSEVGDDYYYDYNQEELEDPGYSTGAAGAESSAGVGGASSSNHHGATGGGRHHEDWIAPPSHVKQGVLGSLLKLYADSESQKSQNTMVNSEQDSLRHGGTSSSGKGSPKRPGLKHTISTDSAATTSSTMGPKSTNNNSHHHHHSKHHKPKWYDHKHSRSMNSLGGLILSTSHTLAAPGSHHAHAAGGGHSSDSPFKPQRPKFVKRHSGNLLKDKEREKEKKKKKEQMKYITVHIADVLQRQRFLLRMCRALMLYGAPTHRLEEYMKMSARVLEINGQFIYIPGCMIVSFGDPSTHTSEMQLVRCVQGLNLDKLQKAHTIYKEVLHDVINVEEASERIDELLASKNRYPEWLCVLLFGLASAMVTPFAFGGWWQDLPMSFFLGGAVGVLQVVVAPRSDLYNNVFEVTSSIVVSFLGRAFGTIGSDGDRVFCFSAVTQGSLAMILPGYMVLTASLELQSKNIVSGSVRMFYAVIYSIFLGFGITLGAAIFGWIHNTAVSDLTCKRNIGPWFKMLFVPGYTFFVALVNQATFRQLPVMIIIASAGYAVTYFTNAQVHGSSQFTSAIGSFVIGVMGNIYSRVGHGLAFAAMLPGIFSLLPGSVAAQGSLIAGLQSANRLVSNANKTTITTTNTVGGHTMTSTWVSTMATSTGSGAPTSGPDQDSNPLSLGLTMIQVCTGITVGLFVATLVIYPFGKKRSGLFTF